MMQIHGHGGITYCASWGKVWFATLGCYDWSGLNPIPPEMFLLPYSGWTGIGYVHPGRFWALMRSVYLPVSYLYGRRCVGSLTPTVLLLRY